MTAPLQGIKVIDWTQVPVSYTHLRAHETQ